MQSHSHSDLSNEWNFFTFLMGFFSSFVFDNFFNEIVWAHSTLLPFQPSFTLGGFSSPLARLAYSASFSTTCCQPTLRSPKCAWSLGIWPPFLHLETSHFLILTRCKQMGSRPSLKLPPAPLVVLKVSKRGIKGPENTETPKNWRCTTSNRAVKEFLEAGSFTFRARGCVFFKGRKGQSGV